MSIGRWPEYDDRQIEAVKAVLRSGLVNYWTGSETSLFEEEFASWCGSKKAVAVANGSLALSAAYVSVGLGKDDEVVTTPRSFIATASSAVLLGAKPVFADVDADSGNITAETIAPLITKKTKAISVVHLGGWPAEMAMIRQLADSHGIAVIEDCAQAHGARIGDRSVGTFGDVAAWSFCQDKIMSTGGEGGMITTEREDIWEKVWSLKDHGKTLSALKRESGTSGFRWVHEGFGSNFRLTEVQSAIGRIQLEKIEEWNRIRCRNAMMIVESLKGCTNVRVPLPRSSQTHAWYKFYAYVKPEALSADWSRDRILKEIELLGYPAMSGSCSEIYLEKCFKVAGIGPDERLDVARRLGEESLMFLVHPTITVEDMERYTEAVRRVVLKALR